MTASRFHFRVWYTPNYEEPAMIYDAEKTYDFITGNPKPIYADCFGSLLDDKDFVVMQSTGLVDKNGKEIFEGDIVNVSNFPNKKDRMRTIEFYKGGFKAISIWGEDYKDKSKVDIFGTCPVCNENWNIEVIGNIYDNKELLEEVK